MTLGNYSKKKVGAYLVFLVPLAVYSIYTNFLTGPDVPASSSTVSRGSSSPEVSIPQPSAPPSAPCRV